MKATTQWNGNQMFARIVAKAWQGIDNAATHFQQKVVEAIGQSSPPASQPGQPPHRRTGNLQRSVVVERNEAAKKVTVRVSRQAPYGVELEYGRPRMAARPFWYRTLRKNWSTLKKLVEKG